MKVSQHALCASLQDMHVERKIVCLREIVERAEIIVGHALRCGAGDSGEQPAVMFAVPCLDEVMVAGKQVGGAGGRRAREGVPQIGREGFCEIGQFAKFGEIGLIQRQTRVGCGTKNASSCTLVVPSLSISAAASRVRT